MIGRINHRIKWTVNGEVLRCVCCVQEEVLRDPAAMARFDAQLAATESKDMAEERWGAGGLTGEFPNFTWTPAGAPPRITQGAA